MKKKKEQNCVTWDQIEDGFYWLITVFTITAVVYFVCSHIIGNKIKDATSSGHASGYKQGLESGCSYAYSQPGSVVNYQQCIEKAEQ